MRFVYLLNTCLITYLLCSPSFGADTVELINKFLENQTKQTATQPKAANRDVRVAQKPKSVLVDLSNEKISTSQPKPVVVTNESKIEDAKVAAERKRIESGIDRKLRNLESSLKSEERRLEKRLAELNTKRQTALEKGDEKTLKRIETMEKQAIVSYEKKIQRLLNSAVASSKPAPVKRPVASSRPRPTSPSWNKTTATKQPTPRTQPRTPAPAPQKRRRIRLWPFN